MKQFALKLSVIAVILALFGGLVFLFLIPDYYIPVLPFLLLFFYVATLSVHALQVKLAKKNPKKFTNNNLLINFLKLILYAAIAFSYLAVHPENALVFVISLLLLYTVFTFVEVMEMARVLKR